MMTTDSSRPLPAPSTLLSPAFAPFAEQNPFPLFSSSFLELLWNLLDEWEWTDKGREFYQNECCSPRTM